MSVYRSLERLCAQSVVQRVETASGYRLCDLPDPMLLNCTRCGTILALPAADPCAVLHTQAQGAGFRVERLVMEAVGICGGCATGGVEEAVPAVQRPVDPGRRDEQQAAQSGASDPALRTGET